MKSVITLVISFCERNSYVVACESTCGAQLRRVRGLRATTRNRADGSEEAGRTCAYQNSGVPGRRWQGEELPTGRYPLRWLHQSSRMDGGQSDRQPTGKPGPGPRRTRDEGADSPRAGYHLQRVGLRLK